MLRCCRTHNSALVDAVHVQAIGQLDRMISNMELTTTHPSSARGNWCPDDRGRLGWLMVGEGELQLAIQQTYDIAEARQQVMMVRHAAMVARGRPCMLPA